MNHSLTIEQVHQTREHGTDDREFSQYCLRRSKNKIACSDQGQVRKQPCGDCAIMDGLYSGIAGACYRGLNPEERRIVAETWDCHNGGRCEGAWQALVEGQDDIS